MKVFGLGLTKTGTTSLSRALRMIGFRTIHYPHDINTCYQLLKNDFSFRFLEHYDAATDITVAKYYSELDKLYPGSKFILTVRDISSWLDACERHWSHRAPVFDQIDNATMIEVLVYGCANYNRDVFISVYEQHLVDVRKYFSGRPSDFLELDIVGGAGWEPLCRFLNRKIPKPSFPNIHKDSRNYKP